MTNQTIPPCPVCGTVPEHHDRIFCGLVNKCNCLSANRDCTIDAWTRWCAEELRRTCRELGIETVEQLKAKVQPDPRVEYLDKMGVNTLSDLIVMAFHASEYSERMNDPRVVGIWTSVFDGCPPDKQAVLFRVQTRSSVFYAEGEYREGKPDLPHNYHASNFGPNVTHWAKILEPEGAMHNCDKRKLIAAQRGDCRDHCEYVK